LRKRLLCVARGTYRAGPGIQSFSFPNTFAGRDACVHVPRTRLALERNGILVTGSAHAAYFEMRDLYSIPREAVAYAVYFAKQ
jgi:hypothetical protein